MPDDLHPTTEDTNHVDHLTSPIDNAEQIQTLLQLLFDNFNTVAPRNAIPPLVHSPGRDLKRYAQWLSEAHRTLGSDLRQNLSLSFVSEWVLDNYYVIRQTLSQIEKDLPQGYFEQLPRLNAGPWKGLPRIYAIAHSMLAFEQALLNLSEVRLVLVRFQERSPLTMGELWALPIFLRYSLIENLAQSLIAVIQPETAPELPLPPEMPFPNAESSTTTPSDRIANIILSLRAISEQRWEVFFEEVSVVEHTLRKDPVGIYSQMDFATRDLYRKEIENLSFASGKTESQIADTCLHLAGDALARYFAQHKPSAAMPAEEISLQLERSSVLPPQEVHVGDYLLGKGRFILEERIGYRSGSKTVLQRWVADHASFVYLYSVAILSTLTFVLLAFTANLPELYAALTSIDHTWPWDISISTPGSPLRWLVMAVLTLALFVPVLTIATSLTNWLITLLVRPKVLPKLEFKEEIPDPFHALVVVPAMITGHDEIESLIAQVELHYLRNPQRGLMFGLLSDFRDADNETLPEDARLVQDASARIQALNERYGFTDNGTSQNIPRPDDAVRFFLFHRKRLWNPSEGKWMGWERKRGKLDELNRLLRGEDHLSFINQEALTPADHRALQKVRYVITLDADTILPIGAASRLVGTLAHPLNQAQFDPGSGKVVSGYTVLQPRMEIHPKSTNHSWFTRIFAGDAGLDLYSLAVSDAYQDLFGVGIYVGKGIYDVDAFRRSVDAHIPENAILSHDLLEGLMGRAGLVADITMIEDYPQNYLIQILRQRRWIRGDWQLLPWLIHPRSFGVHFSIMDRWKIFDNLRRSLLAPALLTLFVVGLVFLPGLAGLWSLLVVLALGIPLITSLARTTLQVIEGSPPRVAARPLAWNFVRWLLAVSFLIYEAYITVDAILTTLYRLIVSRRQLLQWTTAAQTTRIFGLNSRKNVVWQKMTVSVVAALILTLGLQIIFSNSSRGLAPVFTYVSLILLLWMLSPLIVWWINRPIHEDIPVLTAAQETLLHLVARRTWAFFERFVGPEDHWLPPDHYQENPAGIVAHRTSPTNIGLLLTSTLAAYDLGYLDQPALAMRLETTLETLTQLERYRGHLLNWYDTLTLKPLQPRYVSTVDSGNLAASLIITAQACHSLTDDPIFHWQLWQGYVVSLSDLVESLPRTDLGEVVEHASAIRRAVTKLQKEILTVKTRPERWYSLFMKACGPLWAEISHHLLALVETGSRAFQTGELAKLRDAASQIERQHQAVKRTILELTPWISLLETPPESFRAKPFAEVFADLRSELSHRMSLKLLEDHLPPASAHMTRLRELAATSAAPDAAAIEWLNSLEHALGQAREHAQTLQSRIEAIHERALQLASEMDFNFLYDPKRRVFHIGYNLDSSMLDVNYYDLLASEARIASIIAIAKGDVPQAHWLYLGRPVTRVNGMNVLLSWSGTMFEYLMPSLFLRSYEGTMLADSTRGAVHHQIAYARSKGVPWGISESGFYRFDSSQNYQYHAFGAPGLGFKRGLADDLVIAPYASLMALDVAPVAVVNNLSVLLKYDMLGLYGFYEAIDFTGDRLVGDEKSAVVGEYMAHHQGMVLMAMANYFSNNIMVERMHSDPRIQSVELLLQEQAPHAAPLQDPASEDIKGVQRLEDVPDKITPWQVPVHTSIPQMHLLSNGSYTLLISNMGGGYSTWRGTDLTRWQPDGVLDPWGIWIYLQEVYESAGQPGPAWSAAHLPIPGSAAEMQVTYHAHMAVFRRSQEKIDSTLEVTVAPEDPVELRRVHLHNNALQVRRMRLTSYGEVILAPQAADARHPAFNKLFIESDYLAELDLQIFRRRPRSSQEKPIYLGHMLVTDRDSAATKHEADRGRFIGRLRSPQNPAALTGDNYLSGTSEATLDPIFALGKEIVLEANESRYITFLTLVAESREELLAYARHYHSISTIDRAFHQSNIAAQTWLGKQNITNQSFSKLLQTLSTLIYPLAEVRAAPAILAANCLGQSGLWRFGISGDYPILVVELADSQQADVVREALLVHKFLHSRRFMIDLVLVNLQQTNYGAELNGILYRMVNRMNSGEWLNQRGGIFIVHADQMKTDERTLLQSTALMVLNGEKGSLNDQIPEYSTPVHHLPELIPTLPAQPSEVMTEPPYAAALEELPPLQFFNGIGGFSPDGKEYVLDVTAQRVTPAPWINVIGYPEFGFMVSEAGSQCTWAINSGENRLTPWSNDPVRDPSGEALYLRDEETGEIWSPTPLPSGDELPYRVHHGAGYSIFEHHSNGLEQRLTLFASPDDPIKFIHLKLTNTLSHTRRITATQFVEWVLGTTRAANLAHILPEYDQQRECMLASNPYIAEFGERTAFLIASRPIHGLTADRVEFLGRGGNLASPIALRRLGLETRMTPGEEPCGVLQVHIDLPPGATQEVYFALGQGRDRQQALDLAAKYHDPDQVSEALKRTHAFWSHYMDAVQVHTPNAAFDLLLNRWALYQALSCRIWGRTAFYQSSGAFGFRDQLQDVLAFLSIDPTIARRQILRAASHQFEEGDVMHWWHPPSGRGVRTRISDNLLWLPYVTARYLEATGDWELLDEKIDFRKAAPLSDNEEERYSEFPFAEQPASLMEHCLRAIQKGTTMGVHKLPLIGSGDWNDGFNRIGQDGQGESVWLAWFLVDVLQRFAEVCEQKGEKDTAQRMRAQAQSYAASVDRSAWDGNWYYRAFDAQGDPLGSSQNLECQIDAIAQSWAVLSGAGDPQRSRQAMQAVLDRLVRPAQRLVLLFTPPFDNTRRDPGYIKGYRPGIRENGGQYTHAATWTTWAFAAQGNGEKAAELFDLLNPIFQSDTLDKASDYRVEPYVICADVYSVAPFAGRGGWTWYTGSAAWMYRLGLEAMLGFHKVGRSLQISPVIPPDWEQFELHYRFGQSHYHIQVNNPQHCPTQVQQILLDGQPCEDECIYLVDDHQEHHVIVTLGEAERIIGSDA